MMKLTKIILYTALFSGLIISCSTIKDKNLIHASYVAADTLLGTRIKPTLYSEKQPILVASFVNIDNVQYSSTFGRIIAEQIGSRLVQRGYKVIEMKMRGTIFVQEQTGELLLSRKVRELSVEHDAYAVIVGTYGASEKTVYVTAKLIRTQDNVILSSYDYSLPRGPDTKKMLQKKR